MDKTSFENTRASIPPVIAPTGQDQSGIRILDITGSNPNASIQIETPLVGVGATYQLTATESNTMFTFNGLLCLRYIDLAERERTMVIEKFRQATINWSQQLNSVVEKVLDESENGKEEMKFHLVVVTDVSLPLLSSGESPLSARARVF